MPNYGFCTLCETEPCECDVSTPAKEREARMDAQIETLESENADLKSKAVQQHDTILNYRDEVATLKAKLEKVTGQTDWVTCPKCGSEGVLSLKQQASIGIADKEFRIVYDAECIESECGWNYSFRHCAGVAEIASPSGDNPPEKE